MPKGKPYSKEKKTQVAADKANKDFVNNRARPDGPISTYVRAYKDIGLKRKREETKKAAEESPTGVKRKTTFARTGTKNPVTPGEWTTIEARNGVTKVKY